ncbi:MAG TPA: flagellar hook-length control protein FliK, partial [Albitalea sp.]|nr:flagellar hook-length control protein FliK [Albitalea sp.]
QLSAHPIAAAPAALPPVAAPVNSSPVSGEDSPFAKLLSAQPQEPPKAEAGDKPEPADKSDASSSKDKPTTTRPAVNGARNAKPVGTARSSAAREEAPHDDAAKTAAKDGDVVEASASAEAGKSAAPDTASTTMDPALAQWLASLSRPVAPAAASTGAALNAEAKGVAIDAAAPKPLLQPTPLANEIDAREAKGGAHKLPGFEPAEPSRAATDHAALLAALEERPAMTKPAERSTPSDPSVAALAASSAAHAAARAEPIAAAPAINLPTPVNSPEFKAALGMQVSLLARDGVQHAELHLNPAEMGPISVQIALDGSQAQVDFGADSAHTRHLIEAGLPELASALRDAGLTLSGGGVSQHARGQSHGDGAPRERDGAAAPRGVDAADTAAISTRRVNLRLPQGALDLYA